MQLSVGDKLGPYEILAPIGAGGMGEVYRARDPRLNRDVAIKVSAAQFSERFEREAQAIAALNHSHICQVYDVGPNYLVMEFIEGTPLKGPLALDQALRYAVEICDALGAAHKKNITHRDLKPANILLTASGVKLLDFGLAKVVTAKVPDGATQTTALTKAGAIMGTAAYMSPEQAKGDDVDARSDIFSFGAVLYETLTGLRAFSRSSSIETMTAILRDEPVPLTDAPANVSAIVTRCLRKLPADRFQTINEVRAALEAAILAKSQEKQASITVLPLQISLFGNLRISVGGRSITAVNTNRLQSLIAYLILHGDMPQPRERLAFLLWPGSSESQARTNLRQLLHHLKRALPTECNLLVTDHFAVQWRQDAACAVDAVDFQAAIAEAGSARMEKDRAREIQALTTAAQLYEDDLLPGLYDDWLAPLRQDYRRRISEVLYRLATLFEEQKEYTAAIPWAERLVALDSLSEAHHQLVIRLHAANHDRASALRAYHRCMRVLRRELGVEPGAATQELFDRILKEEPGSSLTPAAKPVSHLQKVRALVGRTKEWHYLESAWQLAVEDGPRVAVISGEPGIGKTRLADELYQSCVRQGHAAVRSRCYTGQGQVAYAPVAEWLRSDVVRAGCTNLAPQQLAELARLVPEICEQPGQPRPLAESWQRLYFYESLGAAFGKIRKPALLFLDDMQWCDPDSFEWLNALLTSSAAAGLLLLGTVRAEETGREHPFTRFVAGLRQSGMVLEIPLEPLDAQETVELARLESAKPVESGNLGEIFRATGGNPLFVVESVRAGLRSTRVHAVIAARLSQLTAASYELAGLASVVGRPFSFELLEKATDWDEGSVSQALEELWRRRIIESRGASEYDFTHDRLREVACSELTLVRQRYWHRRVARALAEVYEADIESWNGQIASHFEQAGMAEESIARYAQAAAYARQRYADTEAADLLRRALALCRGFSESDRRLKQELDLLVALGPALVTTEGYSAAEVGEMYDRALDLSRGLDDRNIFVILSGTWLFHTVRGDLEKARHFSLEFLRAAEREPTPGLMLAGNFLLGTSLFHLGQLEASLDHMTAAIRAHSGPSESVLALFAGPDIGVFCRSYLAHLAWHREDGVQADFHAAEAVAMARRINHPFSQAIALDYATMLHVFRGNSRAAVERGREAVELCSRHGFAYYLAMANVLTGWAEAAEGDVAPGLAQLREGLDGMRRLRAELRLPYYCMLQAETFGRAGLVGEALASLSTGFAFAGKNGEEWAVAELHRVQGDLLAAEGKRESARVSFRKGLEAARRSGSLAFERKLSVLADGTAANVFSERS
jgi:serine/threonine protein kinase/predicted ATPase